MCGFMFVYCVCFYSWSLDVLEFFSKMVCFYIYYHFLMEINLSAVYNVEQR